LSFCRHSLTVTGASVPSEGTSHFFHFFAPPNRLPVFWSLILFSRFFFFFFPPPFCFLFQVSGLISLTTPRGPLPPPPSPLFQGTRVVHLVRGFPGVLGFGADAGPPQFFPFFHFLFPGFYCTVLSLYGKIRFFFHENLCSLDLLL